MYTIDGLFIDKNTESFDSLIPTDEIESFESLSPPKWTHLIIPITKKLTKWTGVTCNSSGQFLAACTFNQGIFISSDYGDTWTIPSVNLLYKDLRNISCNGEGNILVTCENNDGIYMSTDYGNTWIKTSAPSPKYWGYVRISSNTNSSGLYTIMGLVQGGGGLIYVSYDTGETWKSNGIQHYWMAGDMDSSGTNLIASDYNALPYIKNINTDNKWVAAGKPIQTQMNTHNVASDGTGKNLAVSLNGLWFSYDYGITWSSSGMPMMGFGPLIFNKTGNLFFAGNRGSNFISVNNDVYDDDKNPIIIKPLVDNSVVGFISAAISDDNWLVACNEVTGVYMIDLNYYISKAAIISTTTEPVA